ncbi:hypothetical protein [Cardinium endosymbiont of Sogatella furcifera]|uniref:hypothetical protein n=1 Tax=Cardinium endosymbiont of Sogatella furcifera TaxID=650378 RepID=UPI0013B465FF|nr:hypothetical protein [Cardinium endosymbiont of Sogatella furcifera]
MQPKKVGFVVFVLLFFFQSIPKTPALGVDFIEKAHFNEDGSGLFSIEVDLTKAGTVLSIIKCLNLNTSCKLIKSIGYKSLHNAEECLKSIADISQVGMRYDEKKLKFELSFNFHTIKALNKAMRKINKGLDPPKITYFSLQDGLFVRQDMNGIAKKVLFYQEYDNCLVKSLDLACFFKQTTYTTIYTFPKEIKDCSNPLSELTKNKKTIRIRHDVFAPDQIEDSIGNRIHFIQ